MDLNGTSGTNGSWQFSPSEVTVDGVVYRRGDRPHVTANFVAFAGPADDVITVDGARYRREPADGYTVAVGPIVVTPPPATITMNGVDYHRT